MKLISKDDSNNRRNQDKIKLVNKDSKQNIVLVNKDDQEQEQDDQDKIAMSHCNFKKKER